MKNFWDKMTTEWVKLYLPYLIGILLLTYIVIRAIILPITHDESGTCIFYSASSLYDIVSYAVPIPNNHILNTLLIKLCTNLSGWAPLSVRMPNILGFILYYSFVVAILKKMSSHAGFILFGIVVLTFNPFLLDFFSVARGYGLSIAFMIAAIYYGICFIESGTKKSLALATTLAAISVYTNFTILNFYAAFIFLLGFIVILKYRSVLLKETAIKLCVIAFISFLLGLISYIPITKMISTDQFVYWGTRGFYEDTIETLLVASIYDSNHYHIAIPILFLIPAHLFLASFVLIIQTIFTNKTIQINKPYHFFLLLFIGTIAVNIAQYYIAGTPFLSTRTALFFYPLYALCIAGLANYLQEKGSKAFKYLIVSVIILGPIHLNRTANFNHCYEWWYEENNIEVMSYLKKEHEKEKTSRPLRLNTNWLFSPSFQYYVTTTDMSWMTLAPYHKETQPNEPYDYYYATQEDLPLLEKNYVKVMDFGWNTRFLMKRK